MSEVSVSSGRQTIVPLTAFLLVMRGEFPDLARAISSRPALVHLKKIRHELWYLKPPNKQMAPIGKPNRRYDLRSGVTNERHISAHAFIILYKGTS